MPVMQYTVAHIANFILECAKDCGTPDITNLKLQKLVYIFFGWSTVVHPSQYLFDDRIEAWDLGPVIPPLYYEFQEFGDKPITRLARLYDESGKDVSSELRMKKEIQGEIRSTLDTLWSIYKGVSAGQLVSLTHEEGTPWWETFDDTLNKEIPKPLIKAYYRKLYEEASRRRRGQ